MAKTFILCSDNLNSHGFILDMEKIDLKRFNSNPVMLYNHRDLVGKWEDIEIKDGKLYGTTDFIEDENEQLASVVANRVDKGYVRGASVGLHIKEVVQTEGSAPVVVAEVMECSVVDIPSDANAIVLYDENNVKLEGQALDLALEKITKPKLEINMKLDAKSAEILGLSADAEASAIGAAVVQLAQERDNLQAKLDKFQNERVDKLLSAAIKDGRIKASEKGSYEELANANFKLAADVLAKLPKVKTVEVYESDKIGLSEIPDDRKDWTSQDWRKKDTKGYLELKANNPELFNKINSK